jgi:hypothetical protein
MRSSRYDYSICAYKLEASLRVGFQICFAFVLAALFWPFNLCCRAFLHRVPAVVQKYSYLTQQPLFSVLMHVVMCSYHSAHKVVLSTTNRALRLRNYTNKRSTSMLPHLVCEIALWCI